MLPASIKGSPYVIDGQYLKPWRCNECPPRPVLKLAIQNSHQGPINGARAQFVNDSLYFLQSACEDINTVLNICRAAKHDLKEVGRGTGQGLAITRSIIIDKHGGDIRVVSKLRCVYR